MIAETVVASDRDCCAQFASRLQSRVGAKRYNMWFDRSASFAFNREEKQLHVAVPNRFVADWIHRHFKDDLCSVAQQELGSDVELDIEVDPSQFARNEQPDDSEQDDTRPAVAACITPSHAKPKPAGGLPLRHKLDNFILGPNNELAYAAAMSLANGDEQSNNPLFIHGGCGLGKTHLLQGVCRQLLDNQPDARVRYTTGEQFTNEFLAAVRNNRMQDFRNSIRKLDLLAVDDVHFLANKQATQQEFLHSFDTIDLSGAKVVLASDSHPKLIKQFSDALVSRCIRGMVVEVSAPDTQTRIRIVKNLAERRGLTLVDTVIDVIASKCCGSVREIEGTLTKLHALANLSQQHNTNGDAIGHALIERLFQTDVQARSHRSVRFDLILNKVTEALGISKSQVLGSSRHRHVVLTRSLVIYLTRQLTSMSYPEIAAAMHRKNHSTIITAAQRIEKQLADCKRVVLPMTHEELSIVELVDRLKYAVTHK